MSNKQLKKKLEVNRRPNVPVYSSEDDQPISEQRTKSKFSHLAVAMDNDDTEQNSDENHLNNEKLDNKMHISKSKKKRNRKKKKEENKEGNIDDWMIMKQFAQDQNSTSINKKETKGIVPVIQQSVIKLMQFDYKKMDAEAELLKIINTAIKGPSGTMAAANSSRYIERKARSSAVNRIINASQFVNNWEIYNAGGLTMDIVENSKSTDEAIEFVYKHSKKYQLLQQHFWAVAKRGDSQQLFDMLNVQQYTWHVDFNIQISISLFMQDQKDVAIVKLAKALYHLEQCQHPRFRLGAPECRLPYRYRENRSFHIALLYHATTLQKRSCPRAALEVCKAMYLLEPEVDPLGAVYLIDSLAVRAAQFDWFEQLHTAMMHSDLHRSASMLPNMLYSRALCTYLLARRANKPKQETLMSKANERLKDAICKYPTMIPYLLDRCSVECDTKTQNCTFIVETKSDQLGLKQLYDVYARRMADLWKSKHVIDWLAKNTGELIDGNFETEEVKKWRKLRQSSSSFACVPPQLQRHIILCWDLQNIPQHVYIDSEQTWTFDPVPPADGINAYEIEEPEHLQPDDSFLAALLRSLNVHYDPEMRAAQQIEEAENGNPQWMPIQMVANGVQEFLQNFMRDINFGDERQHQGDNADDDHIDDID